MPPPHTPPCRGLIDSSLSYTYYLVAKKLLIPYTILNMGKFNIVAFSKTKKYKIIMFSVMALGAIMAILGVIMMAQMSKTGFPRTLELKALAGAEQVAGQENQYNVKISNDQPIVIYTGTGDLVLASPITFVFDEACDAILEPVAPMYREGVTMLRLKETAQNHASCTVRITCGSEKAIILYIETYFDN